MAFAAARQCLGRGFGGEHAGLHGRMVALDLGKVQRAGIAAEQHRAGHGHLRQRIESALGDGARAVGYALAAFQILGDLRVVLEALEFLERRQIGVFVVQIHDQADGHAVVFQVIQEGAAAAGQMDRPAGTVNHQAWLVLLRVDFPDFLEADAVVLRVDVLVELEFANQLLADMATAALAEEGVLGAQLHARDMAVLGFAVLADAHFAGNDALDHAVFDDRRLRGEAGVDFHAQSFGLFAQPAAELAQRDDIVAFVVHRCRHEGVGHLRGLAFTGEEIDFVTRDRHVQRRAFFLPVGEEFVERARLEDRARQQMGPDLGAFFDDTDFQFRTFLLETAGGRQARGARAHDEYVVLHDVAFCFFTHIVIALGWLAAPLVSAYAVGGNGNSHSATSEGRHDGTDVYASPSRMEPPRWRQLQAMRHDGKHDQTFMPGMFSEAVLPPSTGRAWPVMKLASSLARNVIAAASSSGRP